MNLIIIFQIYLSNKQIWIGFSITKKKKTTLKRSKWKNKRRLQEVNFHRHFYLTRLAASTFQKLGCWVPCKPSSNEQSLALYLTFVVVSTLDYTISNIEILYKYYPILCRQMPWWTRFLNAIKMSLFHVL